MEQPRREHELVARRNRFNASAIAIADNIVTTSIPSNASCVQSAGTLGRSGAIWTHSAALTHADAPRPASGMLLPPPPGGRPSSTKRPHRVTDHPINHNVRSAATDRGLRHDWASARTRPAPPTTPTPHRHKRLDGRKRAQIRSSGRSHVRTKPLSTRPTRISARKLISASPRRGSHALDRGPPRSARGRELDPRQPSCRRVDARCIDRKANETDNPLWVKPATAGTGKGIPWITTVAASWWSRKACPRAQSLSTAGHDRRRSATSAQGDGVYAKDQPVISSRNRVAEASAECSAPPATSSLPTNGPGVTCSSACKRARR